MEECSFSDIEKIKEALDRHLVVALPTETVFGLGCYWDDELAFDRIFQIKRRKADKPISIMCSTLFDIESYFEISPGALRIIRTFLPGPLTVILKAKKEVPYISHLGTGKCGIRIPSREDLLGLLNNLKKPLLVTSCNISGEKEMLSSEQCMKEFSTCDLIGAVIKGESRSGVPTTVVDLSQDEPVVLRRGEINTDRIKEIYHG